MSAQQNDGGPAFPRDQQEWGVPGMSLRDWFAGNVPPLPESTSDNYAVALVGESAPPAFDRLAHALYLAKVDAVYRYMQADAMIAARGQA